LQAKQKDEAHKKEVEDVKKAADEESKKAEQI
jgi:hypothetical protein